MDEQANGSRPGSMPAAVPEVYLGTVNSITDGSAEITLDGQTEALSKRYRTLATGRALGAGDRVVILKISGSYVILGALAGSAS